MAEKQFVVTFHGDEDDLPTFGGVVSMLELARDDVLGCEYTVEERIPLPADGYVEDVAKAKEEGYEWS
jgi:hypothetical protein